MSVLSKKSVYAHSWQNPAKLLLVDSHDVGHSVEILLSQDLFGHLGQHHAVNYSGNEGVALGKSTQRQE